MRIFDISKFHPIGQLFFLLGFVVAGMIFSTLFAFAIGMMIWGTDIVTTASVVSENSPENVRAFLKFSQAVVQIGTMLIPPTLFAFFYGKKPFKLLEFNKIKNKWIYFIVVFLPFIILPCVGMLSDWNNVINFPEKLASFERYLRNMEEAAAEMTKIFLQGDTVLGMLLNVFIIALIPAFSEEILFRGAIQNILNRWFRNVHWAVIITAFIFSAIHGQFFGFLPRFALGMMLGYLLVTTGSIWVCIIAHFVNNATVVFVAFLESKSIIETSAEKFGTMENTTVWGMISLIVIAMIVYLLWRKNKKDNDIWAV